MSKKRNHALEHEMDQREMNRLETEIKDLKSQLQSATERLEDKDSLVDLWINYAQGLEARIEIYERGERLRNKATLGPMLQGVGGGLIGAALYGLGASMMKKDLPK